MKKTVLFLLCLHSGLCLLAQQDLGIQNSNYAGIQGALLNPGSIADSRLKWDVNILSGDVIFANTFLYAPKSSVPFLGFKRIIEGSIHENLFDTRFDPQNPNKLYNVTLSTEILGPSFFIKIAKKHEIGLTVAARASGNVRNITGNLGQNAFDYFLNSSNWNTAFRDQSARVNAMAWLEYGLHYATVISDRGLNEIKGGISLNYLQGVGAIYAKNTNVTYKVVDTTAMVFSNTTLDYGRTDFDDLKNLHDRNHGHGFGADLGMTFLHFETDNDKGKDNYLYKIGISLLDLGKINFNRNTGSYHLSAASAVFNSWHEASFADNKQLDQTLSAVFYNGDSSRSQTGASFHMAMPSALSIQADWNIDQHFFANLTVVKGFGHGDNVGVVRPDVYGLTPRYETQWFEVSLPMSLMYYNHWQSRMGFAVRVGYFFFGGDALGGLVKINNLQQADVYAGIHYFVPEKSKHSINNL